MSQYGKPLSCWGSQYFTGKLGFNILFEQRDRNIKRSNHPKLFPKNPEEKQSKASTTILKKMFKLLHIKFS